MLKMFATKNQLVGAIIVCVIGALTMAFAITVFLAPMQIPVGGFTGIATIFSTSGLIKLPIGTLTLLINIPFFLFSYKMLGSRFGVLSIISTLVYTMAMNIFANMGFLAEFGAGINDKALSTVYGASVYGLGLGLIVRMGGSTGGNDMVANMLVKRDNRINVGNVIFGIDFLVIILSAVVFRSYVAPLYAFITSFLSAKVVDYLIEGGKRSKAYYIFSEKSEEVGKTLISELQRGATAFSCRGMYTNKERQMVLCLVLRSQAAMLKNIVKSVDKHAFIFATNVNEAFGEGFTPIEHKPANERKITKAPNPNRKMIKNRRSAKDDIANDLSSINIKKVEK